MTNLFLKAKHWQIFIILFGVPMIFYFVMMNSMFSEIFSGTEPDPERMFDSFLWFPIFIIVSSGTLLSWFWAIGVGLQKHVPESVKMKVTLFKIFLILPGVYLIFFSIYISSFFTNLNLANPETVVNPSIFLIIFPLHIFCMFCLFYCMYFATKTLKSVELQRKAKFDEFIGEFFLLWFNVVGVWILQPRINKIHDRSNMDIEDHLTVE